MAPLAIPAIAAMGGQTSSVGALQQAGALQMGQVAQSAVANAAAQQVANAANTAANAAREAAP